MQRWGYAAAQAGTDREAIDGVALGGEGIHAALDTEPPCDGNELDGIPPCTGSGGTIAANWLLKAGPPFVGECHHQAHLMNVAIQMIGVSAGTEYRTYASTNNHVTGREFTTAAALGITEDLDGDGIVRETDEVLELIFDFNPPPLNPPPDWERFWNNFEGSILAAGKYYAVWPSIEAGTACQLFLQLKTEEGAEQYWIYRGPTGGVAYSYPTKVPFPTCP